MLQSLRERLYKIDPKLEVWWVPNAKRTDPDQRGRWTVVYWMARENVWSAVFHWEDKDGKYRPVGIGVAEPIVEFLMARDFDPIEHNRKVEEREALEERKRQEELYDTWNTGGDMMARVMGVRQTFGPGGIRSRKFARGDMTGEIGNAHQRFLAARAKAWKESK